MHLTGSMKKPYLSAVETLTILLYTLHAIAGSGPEVYMDDPAICSQEGIHMHFMEPGQDVVIYSKKRDKKNFVTEFLDRLLGDKVTSCGIILAPPMNGGKFQFIELKFNSFRISGSSCDTKLSVVESPTNQFEKDVTSMASLSCGSKPEDSYITTTKSNNVKITFQRGERDTDYSYQITAILRSEGKNTNDGLSPGVKIGIGVLGAFVFIVILVLIIKIIKLRLSEKDDAIQTSDSERVPGSSVSRARSNSYVCEPEAQNLVQDNMQPPSYEESHEAYVVMNHPEGQPEDDPSPCPPSYEEALGMAKPADDTDPMYANVKKV